MKRVYVGLLILAVLAGLFIGYYIWAPTCQIPAEFKYDVLKDTLTIVLAIIAVAIASVGYIAYQVLTGRLRTEAMSAARVQMVTSSARLFTHCGYAFWQNYKKAKEAAEEAAKEDQYLALAIKMTEHAIDYMDRLPEEETRESATQKLLCMIKNNLAYYFAERNKPEDRELAKEYAEYIRKKISKYPEAKEEWLETYSFVEEQYPTRAQEDLDP